ncbi:MAG: ABC transporter ATP-binding protein [Thermodesulfobacteriota bacterium]
MSGLLSVSGLSVSFGGVAALEDVGFSAEAGRITALIGPNGAGKTTLINCVSGFVRPDRGEASFAGRPLLGLPAHRVIGLGLARTFQHLRMFGRMNVLENVMVGLHGRMRRGFFAAMLRFPVLRREERGLAEKAMAALAEVGLARAAGKPAGSLPYGDQKRLALARALASDPKMVLLDEPVAGLNPAETRIMADLILAVRGRGVGLVLVEHDMSLVMRVSDTVVALCSGRKIAEGPPAEVQRHPEVVAAYLGGGKEFGLCA